MGVAQIISSDEDVGSRIVSDMRDLAAEKPLYWAIIDLERNNPGTSVNIFKQAIIEGVVTRNPLAKAIHEQGTLRVDYEPLREYEFNGGALSCFSTFQLLKKTRRAVKLEHHLSDADLARLKEDPVPFYLNGSRVARGEVGRWLGELIPNLAIEPIVDGRVMQFVTSAPEVLSLAAGVGACAYFDSHSILAGAGAFAGTDAAIRGFVAMKTGRSLRYTSPWNACLKMDTDFALFRDHPEYLHMSRQSTVFRGSWLTLKAKTNWQYFPEIRSITADQYLSTLQARYQETQLSKR